MEPLISPSLLHGSQFRLLHIIRCLMDHIKQKHFLFEATHIQMYTFLVTAPNMQMVHSRLLQKEKPQTTIHIYYIIHIY